MTEQSDNLSLPYIQPSQAQKHVTHNEALRRLDAVVQLSVQSATLSTPPAATSGQRWIVGPGASGDWSGQDHAIAVFEETAWAFYPPIPGWLAFDQSTSALLVFDGAAWVAATIGDDAFTDGSLSQMGVNTSPDATNRLSVKSDQALFSHDDVTPGSGDMLLVTNKDAPASDAGLGFQTGYSTRALLGLLGNDDWAVKVSPDGASFNTALTVNKDSGNLAMGGATPASGTGTLDVGGALRVHQQPNAHDSASPYTSLVVGGPGQSGGLYAISRQNAANQPFTALCGWDGGAQRWLFYGGGGWSSPDATEHRFYCAPSYSETHNTGKEVLLMQDGLVRVSAPAHQIAASPHGAQMHFKVLEEEITTTSGSFVDSTVQIPNGAIVFNVGIRVTGAITGATSFDVGTPANIGQFGGSLGISAGSTNMGIIGPSGFYADTNIRLTANGADFTAGSVRIAICYYQGLPPQS